MRRMLMVVLVSVHMLRVAQAAAPPAPHRPLSPQERQQVDALAKRMSPSAGKEDFEEVARLARRILALHERVQGKKHHETIDARLNMEQWQRLRQVPATQRGEVVRSLQLTARANALRARARYREAEQAARDSLAICKKTLGEEHPLTAAGYLNLASNLSAQGKAAQAQPLLEKALEIYKKVHGEEHPDTATVSSNMGANLQSLGRHAEAQVLLEKALAIRMKVLGEEHPGTVQLNYGLAASCDLLAGRLTKQGKHQQAQPLYEKALALCRKVGGEEHPLTATCYNNLASNLLAQGKAVQAQPLLEKALAICRKVHGEEHPDTASVYSNLGANLHAQGRRAQAQVVLEKALAIQRKVFGEEHQATASTYNNVAMNLDDQGQYARAQPLYEKALAIYKKVRGEEHLDTARAYDNLAGNLYFQGKQALPFFEKGLAIRQKLLGEDHPSTANSYSNTANCLQLQGKQAQAQVLFEKALAIYKKILGAEHPETAGGYSNVAACLDKQGRYKDAWPLHKEALAIRLERLGADHPDTANSYNNLAFCLSKQGRQGEALPLYEKALAIRRKVLGEGHLDTARTATLVATILWNSGQKEKAMLHWQAARRGHAIARIDRVQSGFDRSLDEGIALSADVALAVALAEQGKPEEAFRHAEANLARGLLDSLGTGTTIHDQERADTQRRVQQLDVYLVPLLGRSRLNEAEQRRRDVLLKQRTELFARLSRQAAEASERLLLPLARIQKQIPDDGAVLLWIDVFVIGGHWACVLRSKGAPLWQRLDGTGPRNGWTEEDRDLPARLLSSLSNPLSNPAERKRLIAAVRKQRLEPLRPHLKGVRRLFVVPVWPMEAVPVEVLTEDYRVSYVPSASLFARSMAAHRPLCGTTLLALGDPIFTVGSPPEPPTQGVMLKVVQPGGNAARAGLQAGDVLLTIGSQRLESPADIRSALARTPVQVTFWRDGTQGTTRLAGTPLGVAVDERSARAAVRAWRRLDRSVGLRGTGHKALPGTRQEVRALARLVSSCTLLLGSAASEQNLDQLASSGKLKGFRLLHFATHGEANSIDPKQSALILAQDRLPFRPADTVLSGAKPIDGRLTVKAILEKWTLDADLVVLSACQSGQGKQAGGEGLLGFAQAFLQKNARAVVLSRWKVDDTATTLLMVRFYENLLGKRKGTKPQGRAAALSEARKWLRHLERKQAGLLAGGLQRGMLRGTEEEVPPLVDKEPELPAGTRPFEHPFFWAAFILVGDPE